MAVTVVGHPLIKHKLTLMRKKDTSTASFRALIAQAPVGSSRRFSSSRAETMSGSETFSRPPSAIVRIASSHARATSAKLEPAASVTVTTLQDVGELAARLCDVDDRTVRRADVGGIFATIARISSATRT